ncbi:PTS transporter subunit EIIC [Spirabiliibacterium falconis]|uniref:PTS transporter subunit EIIC n=1 Tax=Spirabiliibacterium falconis TaxID=572023 RepID=UPI001AAD8B8C|nr:PTS transporter subunit EIIC [Spirabiliibacterium falconis]MBE2894284.1 PTS transporter subunit EIIC [Spirabiliibacterium falconis]
MREKVTNGLQHFSKAMFVPILILPIVGVLIALSNIFTNARLAEYIPFLGAGVIKDFGTILSSSLLSILTNLGLVFCVGLTVGLAKEKKSEAGFTSVLAYLIFTYSMNKFMQINGILYQGESLRGTGQTIVLGVQILDMGIFLGLFLGCIVAYIHNKFCNKEFRSAFQIYGGSRFVFITLIPIVIISAILLTYIWPFVQIGILKLGTVINRSGELGIFIYGMLERLLIPTGLHHLVYTSFLYTPLGGSIEINGQVFEGARNIYYAEMALPSVERLSPTVIWDARGISKMYGLMGACLAMYHMAKPENKLKVKAILIPAAFSSFIAGVTEPIEFTFMFVAPILFIVHAILSGLSMVVLSLLDVRAIGPNGFIDFLIFNLPLGIQKTGWPLYMLVGVIFFFLYYTIFRVLIGYLNLMTIGRENIGEESKLYSRQEYLQQNSKNAVDSDTIIDGLGGASNIISVDNCYTRLRLIVKDENLVDETILTQLTGASAVIKMDKNIQVVYGLKVSSIRKAVDNSLMKLKNKGE